jgi:hypothetical protein
MGDKKSQEGSDGIPQALSSLGNRSLFSLLKNPLKKHLSLVHSVSSYGFAIFKLFSLSQSAKIIRSRSKGIEPGDEIILTKWEFFI